MLSENRKQLFVSYARHDAVPVEQFVNALRQEYQARALPIDVWIDSEDLRPGEQWACHTARIARLFWPLNLCFARIDELDVGEK
jgi:hypothetical protein